MIAPSETDVMANFMIKPQISKARLGIFFFECAVAPAKLLLLRLVLSSDISSPSSGIAAELAELVTGSSSSDNSSLSSGIAEELVELVAGSLS